MCKKAPGQTYILRFNPFLLLMGAEASSSSVDDAYDTQFSAEATTRRAQSSMYRDARLHLDTLPTTRISRQNPLYWSNYSTRRESRIKFLDDSKFGEQQQIRRRLYASTRCTMSESSFMGYDGIDQEDEGACSLVGFLNLIIINEVGISWRGQTSKSVLSSWSAVWEAMQPYAGSYGMDDIASMLDAAQSIDVLWDASPTYVPVRSVDNSENSFNSVFTNGGTNVLQSIEAYIKELIDTGVPVLVNSHEHTRVCVGYDDSSFVPTFIFADSWGNNVNQEEYDPTGRLVNKIQAGYSQAPVSMIVSYVREIVYFQSPQMRQTKRPSVKKTIEKERRRWPAENKMLRISR
jgi:hypothetical protein